LCRDRACPCPNPNKDSHTVRQAHRPEQSRRKGCPYVSFGKAQHDELVESSNRVCPVMEILLNSETTIFSVGMETNRERVCRGSKF